jgi:hypothetical protein
VEPYSGSDAPLIAGSKRPKRGRLAQLKVRLPEELRRDLEYAAGYAGHSMNTEIVRRITESFHKFHRTKLIARALVRELDDAIIDEIIRLRGNTDTKDEDVMAIMEDMERRDVEEEVATNSAFEDEEPE